MASKSPHISTLRPLPHLKSTLKESTLILQSLSLQFHPILKARGYKIAKLSEMCCCVKTSNKIGSNLGILGYCTPAGDSVHSNGIWIRLRRPRPITSDTPLGADDTCKPCHNIQEIESKGHGFMEYDSLVRTMAHEISHIVHGAHSVQFYELMAEILKERDELIRKGLIDESLETESSIASGGGGGGGGSGDFSGEGSKLGGSSSTNKTSKSAIAEAALKRSKMQSLMGSGTTGSKGGSSSSSSSLALSQAQVREARAKSAEQRAAVDRGWCGECLDDDDDNNYVVSGGNSNGNGDDGMQIKPEQEVIDIDSDSDEEDSGRPDKAVVKKQMQKKNPLIKARIQRSLAKPSSSSSSSSSAKNEQPIKKKMQKKNPVIKAHAKNAIEQPSSSSSSSSSSKKRNIEYFDLSDSPEPPPQKQTSSTSSEWTCRNCTVMNNSLVLVCSTCDQPRLSNDETEELLRVQMEKRNEKGILKVIKENSKASSNGGEVEVEDEKGRSVMTFGFDIYGKSKSSSGQMKHMS